MPCLRLYEPINQLKPVADNVWIVDGPEIEFGFFGLKLPFPTRMTIIRLTDGRLFIHSPTPLTAELNSAVVALGPIAWLVAPNRIHYWWIPDWKAAFPGAEIHVAPKVLKQAGERLAACDGVLGETAPPWRSEIDQVAVAGGFMTEFVFLHRASATAVVTDLIENFEPDRITCWWLRLLVRAAGIADPDGKTPPDLRQTFRRNRDAVKAAVKKILAFAPERVILAHGRWYAENGTAEVARAFRWIL